MRAREELTVLARLELDLAPAILHGVSQDELLLYN